MHKLHAHNQTHIQIHTYRRIHSQQLLQKTEWLTNNK